MSPPEAKAVEKEAGLRLVVADPGGTKEKPGGAGSAAKVPSEGSSVLKLHIASNIFTSGLTCAGLVFTPFIF